MRLEALEDRSVPSTVMNLDDSGPDSLRQAILDTPAGGTVDFQSGLTGTIKLTSGELLISKDFTITGPGAGVLTVSGNNASRVFRIAPNLTVALSGLTIADGRSPTDRGGGIYNFLSTLTVADSILRGNSASGLGGGIESEAGTLTVINSTLSGNSAFDGGGIWSNGPLTVIDSTLSGNSANGALSVGGGIYNSGSARVTGSTLSGNSASFGGGILNDNVGTLVLLNSTLSGNSAITNGLGTGLGGAIDGQSGGSLALTSCTVSGNFADRLAGGIAVGNGNALSLRNTIIAGDRAPAPFSPDVVVFAVGPVNSQGHNLIGDGSSASGFTVTDLVGTAANPIDPKLGPLQDNGGPTQTMAPLPGSLALNAGDPAQLGVADQRGVVRSGGVNIGAYQATASAFVVSAPDTADAGVPFDLVVTAVDAFGQTAVGYTGTVQFTSSDGQAALPAGSTLTNGTGTFSATLNSAGSQTVTAALPINSPERQDGESGRLPKFARLLFSRIYGQSRSPPPTPTPAPSRASPP